MDQRAIINQINDANNPILQEALLRLDLIEKKDIDWNSVELKNNDMSTLGIHISIKQLPATLNKLDKMKQMLIQNNNYRGAAYIVAEVGKWYQSQNDNKARKFFDEGQELLKKAREIENINQQKQIIDDLIAKYYASNQVSIEGLENVFS